MLAKNNIFNIRAGSAKWVGMTGTRKGFVEFDTREHAIRAWLILMRTYRNSYGCRTIRQIVTRFAPPSENDTGLYVKQCASWAGMDADRELTCLTDYAFLGAAMARKETSTVVTPEDVLSVMKKYNITVHSS